MCLVVTLLRSDHWGRSFDRSDELLGQEGRKESDRRKGEREKEAELPSIFQFALGSIDVDSRRVVY